MIRIWIRASTSKKEEQVEVKIEMHHQIKSFLNLITVRPLPIRFDVDEFNATSII
jgi:hypothetical protein